jgi:hypothetical protein
MRRVNHSGVYGAAHRRERGVVAIIVALTLAVLIGFAGVAVMPLSIPMSPFSMTLPREILDSGSGTNPTGS